MSRKIRSIIRDDKFTLWMLTIHKNDSDRFFAIQLGLSCVISCDELFYFSGAICQ
jgi:hypothetical protein